MSSGNGSEGLARGGQRARTRGGARRGRVRTRGGKRRLPERPSLSEPGNGSKGLARGGQRARTRGGARRGGVRTRGGKMRLPERPEKETEPYVDCGGSGGSSAGKRPAGAIRHSAKVRRQLSPSSNTNLVDKENSRFLDYGSEEESDFDPEDYSRLTMNRHYTERLIYAEEEDEEDIEASNVRSDNPIPPTSPMPILPTATLEPIDKFKFDWRCISELPRSERNSRREIFSQINVRPTVAFTTPYDSFTSIWDREIVGHIVNETNKYAQRLAAAKIESLAIRPRSRITRWQDTDVDEIYKYLAIVIAMGMIVKNRMEEYWSTAMDIFATPGFSSYMKMDRFILLSRCLHFNDNRDCNPDLMTRPNAKVFKLQPLIDHLNIKFSSLYNLSQSISICESLSLRKGCIYQSSGVGIHEICESKTGYLWRIKVHAGHKTGTLHEGPLSGTISSVVLRLVEGLEHKGHTIWMDNFYHSPALARELKIRGFDCVGPLRSYRQFIPTELAQKSMNDVAVDHVIGCTSGDVDIVVWRHKKLVAFISTYHGIASTRCGSTLKPTVVVDYNTGGVDRKDLLLSMYPMERMRTHVWYKKFFKRLLNASVLNSYILYGNRHNHRQFRKTLVAELLQKHSTPNIRNGPSSSEKVEMHFLGQYPHIRLGKSDRLKRKCVECIKRTVTFCKICNVTLCVFPCFEAYHTR